ncbi:MAG: M56 family metallopeptidase [Candidatus Brocadiales bacterium]
MNVRIKTLQDKRTFKAFGLMILTATVFIAFAGIGATVGMKGLIGSTVSLFYIAFCRCVSFTVCAGTETVNFWNNLAHYLQGPPMAIFFWIGLGVLSAGIIKAIIKVLVLLVNDQRFIKSISAVSLGEYPRHRATLSVLGLSKSFVLFRGDSLKHSFTLGMWKPKIYMSTGTYSYLTDEEFLSAILHENYHRKHKDPLRLFVVIVLKELLFFLPISNYLTKVFLDAKEKAADDSAVYESGKPLELASAIVKLVRPTPHAGWRAYLANSTSGMDTVEERVRRLLEPGLEYTNKRPSRKALFFTIAFCTFFFGAVFVNGLALYTHKEKVTHCVSNSCSMECSSSHQETNHATE